MKKAKYFSASWCGPCKMFKPVVNQLIEDGHNIEILDVDEDRDLAIQYQVMSVPMIVVEEDGKIVDSVLGATSREDIIQRLS